jgi:hypothetical protein
MEDLSFSKDKQHGVWRLVLCVVCCGPPSLLMIEKSLRQRARAFRSARAPTGKAGPARVSRTAPYVVQDRGINMADRRARGVLADFGFATLD